MADEIDRLYQLPLAEFTAARDALAKASGDRRAEIKALEKPTAAAWGVNQLYWKRRRTLDRLLTAFERLRKAQAARLAGKDSASDDAELAHRSALQAAVDEVRDLLRAAGDAASPATMIGVEETLQALPFSAPDGRLTRPLRPVGFGALAGLMDAAAATPSRSADVLAFESRRAPKAKAGSRDHDRHAAAEAKRRAEQVASLEKDVRTARTQERAAAARATATADAATAAARERDRLRDALEAADEDVVVKRRERETAAAEARAAASARQALESELERLRAGR